VFDTRSDSLVVQLWANKDTRTLRTEAVASASVGDGDTDHVASSSGNDDDSSITIEWDGRDRFGNLLYVAAEMGRGRDGGRYELRWLDTSAVKYDWMGTVGNTGP
jgi:hypothetical protein